MRRIIAIILCAAVVVGVMPMVSAQDTGENVTQPVISEDNNYTASEPYIVGELTEKRTENEKQFLMSDRTVMAAVYDTSVHYQKDGKWDNIDNSLSEKTDPDDSEKVLENNKNAFKIKFAKKSNKNKLVSVKKDGFKIKWALDGAKKSSAEVIANNQADNTGNLSALKNISSTVVYKNILSNVDLCYITEGNELKENIILNSKNTPQSFTFVYDCKDLSARLNNDGQVEIYEKNNTDKTVFYLDAPLMLDKEYACSENIELSVENTSKGFKLTVRPDKEWLAAPERVYPITIDPTLAITKPQSEIESNYFVTNNHNTGVAFLYVGNQGQYSLNGTTPTGMGKVYSAVRISNTTLQNVFNGMGAGAEIINAKMALISASVQEPKVAAYKITEDWPAGNGIHSPPPAHDSVILDYNSPDTGVDPIYWDITKAAREWQQNILSNKGILLKSTSEETKIVQYFSSYANRNIVDYKQELVKPAFVITYRNVVGLEDYWSYTTQDTGRYGTGYINNSNGNLTYVHNDTSYNSDINGFTLSHIYNTYTSSSGKGLYGCGWNLNLVQKLEPVTISGNSSVNYVYTDGDGTKHYFVKDGDKSVDEDGLGYTVENLANEGELTKKITTKDGTVMKFDLWHHLRRIIDTNGNTINLNYSPGSPNTIYLTSISTSSGGSFTLNYDSNYVLTSITDNVGRNTYYEYDGSGNLSKITYPDGTYIVLDYYVNWLHGFTAPDGSKLCYDNYPQNGKIYAVCYKGTDGSVTDSKIFTYDYNQTNVRNEFTDKTVTYQFDTFGRTTCIYDSNNNVYSQSYTATSSNLSDIFKNNKITVESGGTNYINNYLANGCFFDGINNWGVISSGVMPTVETSANNSLITTKSLKFSNTEQVISVISQTPTVSSETTYTFSGYLKTENVSSLSHGAGLEIITNNRWLYSDFITGTTDSEINSGFEHISITFTLNPGETILRATAGLYNASGTVYIDSLQLESGDTANQINLIDNSSFERNGGLASTPSSWSINYGDSHSGSTLENSRDGSWSYKICGSLNESRYITKQIPQSGKNGDVYKLGVWAKAKSIPQTSWHEQVFKFTACLYYTDGTSEWFDYDFNTMVQDGQFGHKTIVAKKDYNSIGIYLGYYVNCQEAYFDDIFLYRDTAQSYTYDSNGNVVSASDNAKQKSEYQYKNNSVSRILNPTGTCYEYAYDNNKNLVFSRNSEGLQTRIDYDSHGNATNTVVENGARTSALQTGKTYYIRLKGSGKYLTVENSGTNVVQAEYSGTANQRWKIVKNTNGGLSLCPENASGMALDVYSASDDDLTNIQIYIMNGTPAQTFAFKPTPSYAYQVTPKSSSTGKLLTVNWSDTQNNVTILTDQGNNNGDQSWYFEEVRDASNTQLEDGSVYMFMARNSGKYIDDFNGSNDVGNPVVQYVSNYTDSQKFSLNKYGDTEYFTLTPLKAPTRLLQVSESDIMYGCNYLQLGDSEINDRKLFKFEYNAQYNGYYIIPKYNDAFACDVSNFSISDGAYLIFGAKGVAVNRFFVPEKVSETITSSATYQDNGNYIHTTTDSRGKPTTYGYDTARGLQTSITDAKGNVTNYAYDSQTDRLLSVASGSSAVNYTYNSVGRLSKITSPSGTQYNFEYDPFGKTKKIKVGSRTLTENFYEQYNGNLSYSLYGNGAKVGYTYDSLDRVTQKLYNDVVKVIFKYDKFGNLYSKNDLFTNVLYKYSYDLSGRTPGISGSDGTSVNYVYDDFSRVSKQIAKVQSNTLSTEYLYGKAENGQLNGVIYGIKQNGQNSLSYSYDNLTRLNIRTIDGADSYKTEYSYLDGGSANTTTTMVKTVKNGDDILEYSYDDVGNITEVKKNGTVTESYSYDSLNQLVGATYGGHTYTYIYDNGGNILSVKKDGTTVKSYAYGDAEWKDLLTQYNGETITYDQIGNPLSYRNGFNFTWSNGRQLTGITKDNDSISYLYNADGQRVQKTVNGSVTDYYYINGILQAQKTGDEYILFLYDENGTAYGMVIKNGTTEEYYYYLFNAQGDVIGIVNQDGVQVVSYEYGAWGDITSITGSLAQTIGEKNPIRYRGYYYDTGTGFYYLQSRYYDPEVLRFINADGYVSTGLGLNSCNMFAYCGNNPIDKADYYGYCHGYANNSNLSSPYSGVKYGYKCGSYGIHVRRPKKIDITEKLEEAMITNASALTKYKEKHNYIDSSLYFINHVKPGGEWDFKSQDDWQLDPSTTYVFNNMELRYDDIGNIHYGYVGRVLFSTNALMRAGGLVQIYTGTSKIYYWNTNFDDPRDQWAIGIGCQIWDSEVLK